MRRAGFVVLRALSTRLCAGSVGHRCIGCGATVSRCGGARDVGMRLGEIMDDLLILLYVAVILWVTFGLQRPGMALVVGLVGLGGFMWRALAQQG